MSTHLEQAYELRLADLDEEVRELKQQLHDANVQAAFWRRAAEQAVAGWDALEDKIDEAIQILKAATEQALPGDEACKEIDRALALLVERSPLEPPTADLEHALRELPEVDLGDGRKLRVVEDETPLKEK